MAQSIAVDSSPVDRRLWLACAPPLTRLPEVGSVAYYFPRGHAAQCEELTGAIAAEKLLCLVGAVELLVRGDEVFSRIRLLPVPKQTGDDVGDAKLPEDGVGGHGFVGDDKDGVRDHKENALVGSNQPGQTRESFVRREGEHPVHDALDAHVHRDLVVRRDGRSPVDKLLGDDCCDAFVRREGELRVCDAFVRREDEGDLPVEDILDTLGRSDAKLADDNSGFDRDDGHGMVRDSLVRSNAKVPLEDALVHSDDRSPVDDVRYTKLPIDNARRDEDPDSVDVGHAKLVRRNGRIPVLGDAFVRREAKPAVDEVGDTLVTSPKDNARRDDPSCHADDADGHGLLRVDKLPLDDVAHAKVNMDDVRRGPSLKDVVDHSGCISKNARRGDDVRDNAGRHEGQGPVDVLDNAIHGLPDPVDVTGHARRDPMDSKDTVHVHGSARGGIQASEGHVLASDPRVSIPSGVPVDIPVDIQDALVQAGRGLLVFPKVLTASQVVRSDRGTLNIPLNCATAIFPPLPQPADVEKGHPNQSIAMSDLGGQQFNFKHTLCGVPGKRQRHMLTTGWNKFLEKKTPAEGDVLLFIRCGHELRVALQRTAMPSAFVQAQEVEDAARMAQEGAAFTVTWCPRRGAEFVVPRAEVDQALSMEWTVGMRVSCPTGVVQIGLVHRELPHQLGNKNGTVRAVHAREWNKLTVHWDGEASPVLFRIFGVDIYPRAYSVCVQNVPLRRGCINMDKSFLASPEHGSRKFRRLLTRPVDLRLLLAS